MGGVKVDPDPFHIFAFLKIRKMMVTGFHFSFADQTLINPFPSSHVAWNRHMHIWYRAAVLLFGTFLQKKIHNYLLGTMVR